ECVLAVPRVAVLRIRRPQRFEDRSLRRGAGAREREPEAHLGGIDATAHRQHTRLSEGSVEELRALRARCGGLAGLDERTTAEEMHAIERGPREPDGRWRRREAGPV